MTIERERLRTGSYVATVEIASGESLSAAINLDSITRNEIGDLTKGFRLAGIGVPAVWTTASITIQASPDGGTTWFDVCERSGSEYVVSATAGKAHIVDIADLSGFGYIRLRSGTAASAVAQGGARSLKLWLRDVV